MPDKRSESMSEYVPDRALNCLPENLPDRMSEFMSDE